MPLFSIDQGRLHPVRQSNFLAERQLQELVQSNLENVFSCRFVASEHPTGAQHAGRIDTLALSEDNNPVIIEYKKVESSELINQSLFYLAWLADHHGDFQIASQKAFGKSVDVDWSSIRVICIAPNYKRYDIFAVQMMGADIELWTYRLFDNHTIYFEEVQSKPSGTAVEIDQPSKDPVMVEAGRKAAKTRAAGVYTFEQHLEGKADPVREIALAVQEYVVSLSPSIEEVPKKMYVAYRTTQNLLCMELTKHRVVLYLKLDPKEVEGPVGISRDVSEIGHYGTGDLEINVRKLDDLDLAKPFIEMAYHKVGG